MRVERLEWSDKVRSALEVAVLLTLTGLACEIVRRSNLQLNEASKLGYRRVSWVLLGGAASCGLCALIAAQPRPTPRPRRPQPRRLSSLLRRQQALGAGDQVLTPALLHYAKGTLPNPTQRTFSNTETTVHFESLAELAPDAFVEFEGYFYDLEELKEVTQRRQLTTSQAFGHLDADRAEHMIRVMDQHLINVRIAAVLSTLWAKLVDGKSDLGADLDYLKALTPSDHQFFVLDLITLLRKLPGDTPQRVHLAYRCWQVEKQFDATLAGETVPDRLLRWAKVHDVTLQVSGRAAH